MVTIDNMLPQKNKPGMVDAIIVDYLAQHPDIMAAEVVRNLKLDRSNTSKQLKNLRETGFIINHHKEISVKNQPRDTWRLTMKGFNMALNGSIENPLAIKRYVAAYSEIYPRIRELLDLIERVEIVAGDQAENILRTTIKFMVAMSTLNVSREDQAKMIIALLTILLGHEGVLRFTALGETSRISP
jgi:DNA-binding MarR family transcriptional regulator